MGLKALINEIYEQLPKLLTSEDEQEKEQARIAFGLEEDIDPQKLYKRLCRHANEPPDHPWGAITEIDIPDGHSNAKSLQNTRLLTNYWDQAMLAMFGLYRGLHKNPEEEKIFGEDKSVFQGFMGYLVACREFNWGVLCFFVQLVFLRSRDFRVLPGRKDQGTNSGSLAVGQG